MSSMQTSVEAVRKSLVVECSLERAFEVFTREIGTWWPKHTHSIGHEQIVEIVFEERVAGRVGPRPRLGAARPVLDELVPGS